MPFTETDIPGLLVFEPKMFEDDRGYFFESYNEAVFHRQGIYIQWVQENQSLSLGGVIRGLHYQLPPYAQTKLIRIVRGKVFDVVVDIRKGSPTFGKSYSIVLSAKNKKQLLIPRGFAHGFSVLSDKAEVMYKCDAFYNKESEGGILFNDPGLSIDWGMPLEMAVVSEKDKQLPLFKDCLNTFEYEG